MKRDFIKRLYKIKERLYLEAQYLSEFGFGIGQPIKYLVDQVNKQITVIPAEIDSRKHVAKTTQKNGKTVPVIDIKADEVKTFFAAHKKIEVEIQKSKIVFTVLEESNELPLDNIIDFEIVKAEKENSQQAKYAVSVGEFAKVVNAESSSIFDVFRTSEYSNTPNLKAKAIKMISLFSGCGSMDKGFLDEGYNIVFANDRYEKKALRDFHIATYKQNIGDHIIMKDVLEFTEADIPQVDFLAAGIPCVQFSALNVINNFRDSLAKFHPLVEQTLNIIKWSKAKAFLIENVENFLTVKNGAMLERFKERLSDFGITAKVIDSCNLGSAQKRRRSFIFGLKGSVPQLDIPHLSEYRTVRDAFHDIETAPQQDLYFVPTPKTLERMKWVRPGGNINDVPIHLRAPNKKFSNYCQRLDFDSQSPVITHVQDEVFIHPSEDRYLSVRETARLFSLPDDFKFVGSLTSIFEMLKNAVDYRVSKYLARTIKNQLLPIL